ncbi:MAG TPA: D-sedoheptulose 7-phosphate isomerase [Candidatus Dormibacteraeota bacterium]|nr:D-sedoheptulose 7-phosphate isomerase [Candidatus Dormibacteraeota bacterium]
MERGRSTQRDKEISLALASIQRSIEAKERLSKECLSDIIEMAHIIATALHKGKRVIFFGNGGSAADAQHISAELVGKFKRARPPLRALALTTNTSILTAIGNDFSFDEIFSRQVHATMERGDVAVGISTSGRSKNVILGVHAAARIGARTIALTGGDGGPLAPLCEHKVIVPSSDTQRIQECHIMIGHVVCELIDEALVEKKAEKWTRTFRRDRKTVLPLVAAT